MKKTVAFMLMVILAAALACSMGGTALAAAAGDSIGSTVKLSTESLPGAGTVAVTVTINNKGTAPISNVKLVYPAPTSSTIDMSNFAAGEAKEHSNSAWNISEDMLDKPLQFMVYWTSSDGTQKSGSTPSVTIKKQAQNLNVTGSDSADASEVAQGDRVKFTFSIKNEGNVRVDNAYLNAPPLENGGQIGENFSLNPGDSKSMTWTIPVNASLDVKPVFTYAAGGTQYTLALDTLSVTVKAAAKTASISVAADVDTTTVEPGGTVTFNVRVKNTGTANISGISVRDFGNNSVSVSPTSLQPGETATGTATAQITQSGSYSFTATAQGEQGDSISGQSNAVSISTDAEPSASASAAAETDTAKAVQLNLELVPQLPAPGEMQIGFEVVNLTDQPLKNVVVSETMTNVTLGTLAELGAAQSQSFTKGFLVQETGNFIFKVTGELPDGTPVSSQTQPVAITVEGAADTGMPEWQTALIVVLVAIGGVGAALGVYLYKNKGRIKGGASPSRPRPQPRPPQSSANGRPRPERYGYDRAYGGDRPDSRQPQPRQKPPRVETIEPKPRPAEPPQKPQGAKPKGGGTQFGDRNKF